MKQKEGFYIVTIRDAWGDKIANKTLVEGDNTTIADVLRQSSYEARIQRMKEKFVDKYKTTNFRNWWIATVPESPPLPPPPPEPIGFDALVNMNMV